MNAKKIVLGLLAAMALSTQAQPFNQGLFGAGKILSFDCDTAGVSEGAAGANVTWTIPLTIHDSLNSNAQALAAAGTPYFSKFPSATDVLLSRSTITEYSYYRLTSDSIVLLGFADSLQTVVYTDPELIDLRTLAFGGSFTDAFGYTDTVASSGMNLISKINGTKTVTFDGTGTLVVPWKTFSHAMRFKSVTVQTDSTWLGATFASASTITTTNFSWEDTTLPKNTSLSISTVTQKVGALSITSKTVIYLEPVGTAVIGTVEPQTRAVPNPLVISQFDNTIAIKIPSAPSGGNVSFVAYDLGGKVTARAMLQPGAAGLAQGHISNRLSKGIYLYTLKGGDGIFGRGKFVVR